MDACGTKVGELLAARGPSFASFLWKLCGASLDAGTLCREGPAPSTSELHHSWRHLDLVPGSHLWTLIRSSRCNGFEPLETGVPYHCLHTNTGSYSHRDPTSTSVHRPETSLIRRTPIGLSRWKQWLRGHPIVPLLPVQDVALHTEHIVAADRPDEALIVIAGWLHVLVGM